jgi:hypothetical protein
VEAFEHPWHVASRDPDSGVGDDQLHSAVGADAKADADPSLQRVLDRVGQQVQQIFSHMLGSSSTPGGQVRAVQYELQAGACGSRGKGLGDAPGESGQVHRSAIRDELPAFELGEVQYGVDQPAQPAAVAPDQLQPGPLLPEQGVVGVVEGILGGTGDQGQWSAQLVADPSEELGLGPVKARRAPQRGVVRLRRPARR